MTYFTCISILPACLHVQHMHAGALGNQKRESYFLKLELQVLGIEMGYSVRTACTPCKPSGVPDWLVITLYASFCICLNHFFQTAVLAHRSPWALETALSRYSLPPTGSFLEMTNVPLEYQSPVCTTQLRPYLNPSIILGKTKTK